MWEKTKRCFGSCIVLTVGGTLLMIIVMIAILKTTIVIVNFNWHQLFDLPTFLGCLGSLSLPNTGDGDGGVQPWQCWDFYHHLYRCHRGESLSDRISTLSLFFCNEKNSSFKVMVMVILFYLWLCVVSLYQSLKEIQNLGSDQVSMSGKGWLSLLHYLHTSYFPILVHHRII